MDNYIDVIQKNWQDMWNSRMFLCGNIPYNKLLSSQREHEAQKTIVTGFHARFSVSSGDRIRESTICGQLKKLCVAW